MCEWSRKGAGLSHQEPRGQSATASIWVVTTRKSTLIDDQIDAFIPSATEMVASVVLLTASISGFASSVVMPMSANLPAAGETSTAV